MAGGVKFNRVVRLIYSTSLSVLSVYELDTYANSLRDDAVCSQRSRTLDKVNVLAIPVGHIHIENSVASHRVGNAAQKMLVQLAHRTATSSRPTSVRASILVSRAGACPLSPRERHGQWQLLELVTGILPPLSLLQESPRQTRSMQLFQRISPQKEFPEERREKSPVQHRSRRQPEARMPELHSVNES
jgi:hypothetical protein